jgi:hypothetical protein
MELVSLSFMILHTYLIVPDANLLLTHHCLVANSSTDTALYWAKIYLFLYSANIYLNYLMNSTEHSP